MVASILMFMGGVFIVIVFIMLVILLIQLAEHLKDKRMQYKSTYRYKVGRVKPIADCYCGDCRHYVRKENGNNFCGHNAINSDYVINEAWFCHWGERK